MEITLEEKKALLKAARETIHAAFGRMDTPAPDYSKYPALKWESGAFVTLTINQELRGCIGYIESDKYLYETICDAAKQAAFHDPRFYPLSAKEYEQVEIEISVLTPAEPIKSYDEIEIGKHGLIVQENGRRGLLLPQVATEYNMTRDEFLEAICQKAGLDKNLWRRKQINLMVFSALVFNEKEIGEGHGN